MGNTLSQCWPSWEETTTKARGVSRHATRESNKLALLAQRDVAHAKNALYRGREKDARRLLRRAAMHERRAQRYAALEAEAGEASDLVHVTKLRGDLMSVYADLGQHAKDINATQSAEKLSKQVTTVAQTQYLYQKNAEAFALVNESVDEAAEALNDDSFDADEDPWASQMFDSLKLQLLEERTARGDGPSPAPRMWIDDMAH